MERTVWASLGSRGAAVSGPEFEIAVRGPKREFGRRRVDEAWLRPLLDEVHWRAQRCGRIDPESDVAWEIHAVFASGRPGEVVSLEVHVVSDTKRFMQKASLRIFLEPARALIRELVDRDRLARTDDFDIVILARERRTAEPETVSPARIGRARLLRISGRLDEWRSRSRLLNGGAHCEEDTPVFVEERILEQAKVYCRRPGAREGGALLVGRLVEQVEPAREIFVCVEAAFEAHDAHRERFSLTPTPETWLRFEETLERRRNRLGRPEEMLMGTAHGHNFLPSLDENGMPHCPRCPKRPTCDLHSAFFSREDVAFHEALFAGRPFAVGLVFGLDPRGEDVLRIYGFRDGVIQERSLYVVA